MIHAAMAVGQYVNGPAGFEPAGSARAVDPRTNQPLPTWAEAIEELSEPDAAPARRIRVGRSATSANSCWSTRYGRADHGGS
jgi:hypothetical protein